MRAAGYIRVSTAEQAMHGFSLDAQKELIERYAADHGMKLVGVYADEGKSASKALARRPELLRMVADAESGQFDTILFKDLTRWSRNPSQFYAIQDRLDAAKVSWIAIEQPSLEMYLVLAFCSFFFFFFLTGGSHGLTFYFPP